MADEWGFTPTEYESLLQRYEQILTDAMERLTDPEIHYDVRRTLLVQFGDCHAAFMKHTDTYLTRNQP